MTSNRFKFGKNWKSYIEKYFDNAHLTHAEYSLKDFLANHAIKGKSFIDIGCGSGIFSLAAYQAGASRIFSFDIDEDSVQCIKQLWQREGKPDNWTVGTGSILDDDFISQIGLFDIVYSWGVLHHTGNMWRAIYNASQLVTQNGLLYIAIYNRADGFAFYSDGRFGPSSFWEKEKKIYSQLHPLLQNIIDYTVMAVLVFIYMAKLKNPYKMIQSHSSLHRGMSWRVDIKDWLGGYPYEYASVEEIFRFLKQFNFALENLKCNNGLLNNEFLFKKY